MNSKPWLPAATAALYTLLGAVPSPAATTVDDFLVTVEGHPIEISSDQLLANDQYEPFLHFNLVLDSQPLGTLTPKGESYAYTPPKELIGVDSFRYHIETSAGVSNSATVRIHVSPYLAPVAGDWHEAGSLLVGVWVNAATPYFILCQSLFEDPVCPRYELTPQYYGMLPVAGDWDGDTRDEVGLYDPASGRFYLFDIGPGYALPALRDYLLGQGAKGFTPLAGDWDDDGVASAGIRRTDGQFRLKNAQEAGSFDYVFEISDTSKVWFPFYGDWNLDGADGVGLFDAATRTVYLRNALSTGPAEIQHQVAVGDPQAVPVTGAGTFVGGSDYYLVLFNRLNATFYIVYSNPSNPLIVVTIPTDPDG